MPYKIGSKTTKGWSIKKQNSKGRWIVVGHSLTKEKAKQAVKARYASENKK